MCKKEKDVPVNTHMRTEVEQEKTNTVGLREIRLGPRRLLFDIGVRQVYE